MNTPHFALFLGFLMAIASQLSTQLQQDLNFGNILLDEEALYIRKEITGSGIQTLLDGTTEKVVGICNFDKNRLDQGRAVVFNNISFMYGTNAASGKAGEVSYTAVAPKELQNAQLRVTQNGRVILDLPVKTLTNLEVAQNIQDEFRSLYTCRHFCDAQNVEINLEFPPNVSLPAGTNKHYVEIMFSGVKTVRKANA